MRQLFKKIVVFILAWESKKILKKYKPKIVAITGSVGKTSAKDAVATALEAKFRVRKSEKSYNSEIGVPLTIIGAKSGWGSILEWLNIIKEGLRIIFSKERYPEVLVLEVGADRPGDIKKIRSLIKPNVAIVTALAEIPVHVEFFESPEQVFEEKAELIKNLSADDFVVLNADDEKVMAMKDGIDAKLISFGTKKGADMKGEEYRVIVRRENKKSLPEGITFLASAENERLPVKLLGTFGRHNVYAALAALAAAKALDVKFEDAAERLSLYSSPPGRFKLIRGIKDTQIFDDSYNSSPKALRASLETFFFFKGTRKIAVLGDMLELGKHTITAHREIGEMLPEKLDLLFIVGVRAKFFAEAAITKGFNPKNIFYFSDAESAAKELESALEQGDMVLVKGSQGMRLEKLIEALMAEPERKEELLCRQEKEWKKR